MFLTSNYERWMAYLKHKKTVYELMHEELNEFMENKIMAKKVEKQEGVELANTYMLKKIAAFLTSKKFYGKELPDAEQMKKAAFDISKRGKLYKMLTAAGIRTHFDLTVGTEKTNINEASFGIYAKIIQQYRAQVIKKSFAHRKDECK